jgi:uncharacterized protein
MRFLAALGLAAVALAGGADAPATTPSTANTVTVNGTGTATAVPDEASFSFTVETKAATAAAALARNSAEARAVIAAVEGAGVAEADVQTAEVSLDPVASADGSTIVAFTASNTITVRTLSIARAGAVVDAAVSAGATGVAGPSLTVSGQDALYAQALEAAVAQARAKAQALAEAAGRSLGGVISITEGGGAIPIVAGGRADAAQGVPISPGTQDVQASVTVTYALG